MKRLRNASTLEHNAPGTLVSINVPLSEITKLHNEKVLVEINCKSFFSKIATTATNNLALSKLESRLSNPALLPPMPGATSDQPLFAKPPRVTNRYDNIIDQLERKYYQESILQSKPDGGSDSSDEEPENEEIGAAESDSDNNIASIDGGSKTTKKVVGKKKKIFAEDYDMEDPFIDDEEAIHEVEACMKRKKTKTKHDGFFVSSGKLDVLSPAKAARGAASSASNSSKQTKGANKSVTISAKTTVATIDAGGAGIDSTKVVVVDGMPSSQPAAAKLKKSAKSVASEAASSLGAGSGPEVGSAADGTAAPQKVKKPRKPKAAPVPVEKVESGGGQSAPPMSVAAAAVSTGSAPMSVAVNEHAPANAAGGSGSSSHVPIASPVSAAVMAGVAAAEKEKEKEKDKNKPVWQPTADILAALSTLRETFGESGLKLSKTSNIPKSLEAPLNAVDRVVVSVFSAGELMRTCGYYEGVQEILGGDVNVGKVRSLLVRLRLKDAADKFRKELDVNILALKAELGASVVPCPETQQPGYRLAKKSLTQSFTQSGPGDDAAAGGAGGGEGTEAGSAAEPAEAATGSAREAEAEVAPAVVVTGATAAAGAGAGREDADLGGNNPNASLLSTEVSSPGPVASASSAAAAAVVVVPMVYQWMVRWTQAQRGKVIALEAQALEWMAAENMYREKLTVFDKKYIDEREVGWEAGCYDVYSAIQRSAMVSV
jgi:hypothetical protein